MAKKSRAKKYWYTVAYVTREGNPDPHHAHHNFTQIYMQLALVREDLKRIMGLDLTTTSREATS